MEQEPLMEAADIAGEVPGEVYCFLDHQRPCTAECAAYKTFPEDNKQLDSHQRYCTLLQTMERGSRSLNILAGLVHQLLNKQKRAEADAQRERAFDPSPSPTVGTKAP